MIAIPLTIAFIIGVAFAAEDRPGFSERSPLT
jgi:hypothetical protein